MKIAGNAVVHFFKDGVHQVFTGVRVKYFPACFGVVFFVK